MGGVVLWHPFREEVGARHLKQPISGYWRLDRVRLKDSIPGVIVNRLGATRQRSADFIGQRQS